MDTAHSPTYHLIKDVIKELLTWDWKGDRKAHTPGLTRTYTTMYKAPAGTCHTLPHVTTAPASGSRSH